MADEALPVELNGTEITHIGMDHVSVYSELEELTGECRKLVEFCKGIKTGDRWTKAPDVKGLSLGIREWRGCIEMKARMLGMYDSANSDLVAAYMKKYTDAVVNALDEHPDAKVKVIKAIEAIESK